MLSLKYKILLFLIGFTAIISQLLIIREFLNVFEGNELIVGLFFCLWMMLTAAGSFAAVKFPRPSGINSSGTLLLVMSALPSAEIGSLYCLQTLFFPPGSDISLLFIMLTGVFILLPLCFVSGRLFTLAASELSLLSGKNSVSLSYSWESAGSIFAGMLFITEIPFILSTFQIAAIVAFINLVIFLFVVPAHSRIKFSTIAIVLLYVIVTLIAERPIQRMHFRNQQLLQWLNTPYGSISVTGTGGQNNIYLNSNPLLFNDPYFYEEPVHFVLAQTNRPENVLILSGGLNQLSEVLKYPSVKSVDYIDINPVLVELNQRYSDPVNDERIHIIIDDPRTFIHQTQKKYHAIVINVPDPSTAQINRFFTREFFNEIKPVLTDQGILGISLGSSGNYMNDEALQLNGIINVTINKVFKNVIVIPGGRNYYIASDAPVTSRIIDRLSIAGIQAAYVNSFYFDDDLLEQRSNEIMNQINQGSYLVNSDLRPRAYFLQIGFNLKRSGNNQFLILVALVFLAVLLVLITFSTKREYYRVFSSSLAASAGQFLLVFIFQIIFGNMYRMLGTLIAFYMAGLTIGSMLRTEGLKKITLLSHSAQWMLVLLLAGIGFFAYYIINSTIFAGVFIQVVLHCFSFAIAFFFALIFNISTQLYNQPLHKTAGSLYGVDLAGSAAGIILISLVLLPLVGFSYSCFIAAMIVLLYSLFFPARPPA